MAQRRRSSGLIHHQGDRVDKRLSAVYYLSNANEPVLDDLQSKLQDLEAALDKMPEEKRVAYTEAVKRGGLIQERETIAFLRSEEWDVEKAATRIVRNWDERLRLFGEEKAYLPLTLEGAFRDDKAVLEKAFVQVTQAEDDAGRGILFLSPHKYKRGEFPVDAQVRAIWYMTLALLENENVQKNGFIFMLNASQVSPINMHRALQKKAAYSVGHCLPLRIGAFHVCQPTWPFRLALPFIKFFIRDPLASKIKVAHGTSEEIITKLGEYGIKPSQIPSDIAGGEYELDNAKWLAERKGAGK